MKKWIFRLILLVIVAGLGYGAYRFLNQFEQKQAVVPTAPVRKGEVVIRSYTRGELRAVRSAILTAPNLFGTVQVTRLAPLGALSHEKDLIVEFDDSEVQSRLDDKQLEVDQLDEQLKQNQADLEIRNNQDQVELLSARYAVRRAELEVKRNELLSTIDQKKNLLNLDEAQRRYKELESDIKSRLQQSEAQLAVLREKKNKGLLELARERQRLMQVKLLAPMEGLVALRPNRSGIMMYYPGMQIPDVREGDQVYPGSPVADILDLSEMEVAAKVGELDRANLHEGQDVSMRLDAVPDRVFHGRIKGLSGTASANIWSGDPSKKFDVVFSVDMKELLAGLGANSEQIRRVLEIAERNRKKPAVGGGGPMMAGGGPMMMMARGGGPGGMSGGMPGGMSGGAPGGAMVMTQTAPGPGMPGAPATAGPGGQGGERRGFGGMQLTSEQQQKLREEMTKLMAGKNPMEMTPEEQQKMRDGMRQVFEKVTGQKPPERFGQRGQRGEGGDRGQRGGEPGEGAQGRARRGESGGSVEGRNVIRFSAPGGPGGPGGAPGMPGTVAVAPSGQGGAPAMTPMPMMGFGAPQQFNEKDLQNAKLPPPPEEASELEVLLRPGLLADVEIIVEKVPDAIHIPVQAVFEKDGKPVVYVKTGAQFEERVIKPLKRSESVMVVAEGIKPGEHVALSNPNARKGGTKKGGDNKTAAVPAVGAPGAGGK